MAIGDAAGGTTEPPLPRAVLPGNVWPAVVDGAAARALALQYQLAQSQWWPAETLRKWQLRQLAVLLRHAAATVPHYAALPLRELLDDEGGVRPEAWAGLPVLSRGVAQSAGTALASRAVPPAHGHVSVVRTSGSTGRPVEVGNTALMGLYWNAFTLRDHLWHRRDLAGRLAVIRFPHGDPVPPGGVRRRGWGPATDEAFQTGESAMLSVHTDVGEQAEWLVRENPDYLLTYPSNALALAEHCAARGMSLPRLREVRTISEMLPADVREACRHVWNVPVVDAYSIQESGYLALQCPLHEHYHVQAESALVEVLDDDGRPCAPGQAGRVVVTALHNFASVLLRYEVGDYAEVGEACRCGRSLPVLARILGRYRNLAMYPDGRTFWPRLGQGLVRAVAPIGQMQIVQQSLEEMEFRYTAERDLDEAELAGLARVLQENMGYPFRVTLTRLASIPRSASGKFEDFVCRVARHG